MVSPGVPRETFDRIVDQIEERAKSVNASAAAEIGRVWTQPIIAATQVAVDAALSETTRTALGEAADDRARVKAAIELPLNSALSDAYAVMLRLLADAIINGYETGLTLRAEAHNQGGGDQANVAVTAEDRTELMRYPVLGHTTQQWVGRLIGQAQWDYESIALQAVTGQNELRTLPQRLAELNAKVSASVGSAAEQAFLAGTQAAAEEWRQYLIALAGAA